MLTEIQKQFDDKLKEEEKILRENIRNQTKNQLEETIREVENIERVHKIKLQQIIEDNHFDLEKYKQELNLRVNLFLFLSFYYYFNHHEKIDRKRTTRSRKNSKRN